MRGEAARAVRGRTLMVAVAAMVALAGVAPSGAQVLYPTRPIEFVIPFAPGGPTDTAIRIVQPQLSANLGVPLVLVNKAGGGGALGMDAVAKAKPDGYTLAATVRSTVTILPATQPDITYKISDFAVVGSYVVDSQVILVKAGAPWKTLEDLIDHAKKNPGKLSYGSAGLGTNSFFTMELLKLTYGLDMTHDAVSDQERRRGGPGHRGGEADRDYPQRAYHDRERPARRVAEHLGGDLCARQDAQGDRGPPRPGAREDHEGPGRDRGHREGRPRGRAAWPGGDAEAHPA